MWLRRVSTWSLRSPYLGIASPSSYDIPFSHSSLFALCVLSCVCVCVCCLCRKRSIVPCVITRRRISSYQSCLRSFTCINSHVPLHISMPLVYASVETNNNNNNDSKKRRRMDSGVGNSYSVCVFVVVLVTLLFVSFSNSIVISSHKMYYSIRRHPS